MAFSSCCRLALQVHVVVKATDNNMKRVAKRFLSSLARCYISLEIIIPNQITSAILTQVRDDVPSCLQVPGAGGEGGTLPSCLQAAEL